MPMRSLTPASVTQRPFGVLPDGTPLEAWTLTSASGLVAEILPYGATLRRLLVPVAEGDPVDVVLGHPTLEACLQDRAYLGVIVGRIAGRVAGGIVFVDGKPVQLVCNEGSNHLHGGARGLSRRLWKAAPVPAADGDAALRLECVSPDGEEGYPGELRIRLTYTATSASNLVLDIEAISDRLTPFSPTHHAYFNLSGGAAGDVLDHTLQIAADTYAPRDPQSSPECRYVPVAQETNDLRAPRTLRSIVSTIDEAHGDLYRIAPRGTDPDLHVAAHLASPQTGIALSVFTTETHLQLYTASAFDGSLHGKSLQTYPRHAGVCFECQGHPNAGRSPEVPGNLLQPGVPNHRRTVFAFSST